MVCALLVIAAWHALSYGPPGPRALAAAGALLELIFALASGSVRTLRPFALPLAVLAAVAVLGGLALLGRHHGRRLAAFAAVVLVCTQVGEAAATSAVATRLRLAHMSDYAPWGTRQQRQSEAIDRADGWPRYRTEPGREETVGNDPLMVGGQGAQYYSSLTSDVLGRMLIALGDGYTSRGRSPQSLDNAVTDAVFSVGARVHSPPDPHQKWFPQDGSRVTVTRQDAPPLVTVRPPDGRAHSRTGVSAFGPSPYRNQELLLGTRVYTVPRLTVRTAAGKPPSRSNDARPGLRLGPCPTRPPHGSRRSRAAARPATRCTCGRRTSRAPRGSPAPPPTG